MLMARLLEQRRTTGLVAEAVRCTARQVGIAERTLWRWLAGGLPRTHARSSYALTETDRAAYAAARGNVAAAWRAQRQARQPVPALRTFQTAIARELLPIERAAAANGIEGQRRHMVYLRRDALHRNACWEADHVELPVLVLPPRATRPCRPWATLFIDTYSRLLMGWALALAPSAATVLAALRMGLVVQPERGPFGGIPCELRPDHGLEFAAEALAAVAMTLVIRIRPAPPFTPHLKGKVERLNRTVAKGPGVIRRPLRCSASAVSGVKSAAAPSERRRRLHDAAAQGLRPAPGVRSEAPGAPRGPVRAGQPPAAQTLLVQHGLDFQLLVIQDEVQPRCKGWPNRGGMDAHTLLPIHHHRVEVHVDSLEHGLLIVASLGKTPVED